VPQTATLNAKACPEDEELQVLLLVATVGLLLLASEYTETAPCLTGQVCGLRFLATG
jgi:hypothetical protein